MSIIDGDTNRSLADVADADAGHKVIVIARLNVKAVILDVGAVREIKSTKISIVDGGRDLLVITEETDGSIKEFDGHLRSTGSISPDVIAAFEMSASGNSLDGADAISVSDGARERSTIVVAVRAKVRDRELVRDGEGGGLKRIADLTRNKERETEGRSNFDVFKIIVELNGFIVTLIRVLDKINDVGAISRNVTRVDIVLLDVQRVTDGEIEVVVEVVGEGLSGSADGDVISTLLKGADIKEERAGKSGIGSVVCGDSHARGDGAFSISRGTSNGVLLDKDLDGTAGGGDKDGEGGSIISNGGGLVIEGLVLVGISDLGESLSLDDFLDGGLVVISVESELRVGRVLDADKVSSGLSSARGKTDGINNTP